MLLYRNDFHNQQSCLLKKGTAIVVKIAENRRKSRAFMRYSSVTSVAHRLHISHNIDQKMVEMVSGQVDGSF